MNIKALLRRTMDIRVIRYLSVGGLLFLIDLGVVYALVVGSGMNPGIAQLFGRTTGALTGFFLHRSFTYRSSSGHFRIGMAGQGGGYLLLGVSTIMISPFILLAFLELLGNRLVLAKVFTEIVIVAGNYLAMGLLFRHKSHS